MGLSHYQNLFSLFTGEEKSQDYVKYKTMQFPKWLFCSSSRSTRFLMLLQLDNVFTPSQQILFAGCEERCLRCCASRRERLFLPNKTNRFSAVRLLWIPCHGLSLCFLSHRSESCWAGVVSAPREALGQTEHPKWRMILSCTWSTKMDYREIRIRDSTERAVVVYKIENCWWFCQEF